MACSAVSHVLTRRRHLDWNVEEGRGHGAYSRIRRRPSNEQNSPRGDTDADKRVDRIGEAAEQYRHDLSVEWLGAPLPRWSR